MSRDDPSRDDPSRDDTSRDDPSRDDSRRGTPPVLVYCGPDAGWASVEATAGSWTTLGRATLVRAPVERAALLEHLKEASAYIDAALKIRVDAGLIESAPGLRVVATASTGSSHIDEGLLDEKGITLMTLKGRRELLQNLTPAAELSWLLLMACARKLSAARSHVLEGGWDRSLFPGLMLRGRRLGLIGCGRIGGWMARYARAFDMEVVGFDPHLESFPPEIEPVDRNTLLSTSDFVSLHVHLSDETRGFFSRDCIFGMKPGAVFVNTSRGELTDEAALVEALSSGRLAAAGVDVLGGEPDVEDHPLIRFAREDDRLLITPHIGGFSPDALALVVADTTRRVLEALGLEADHHG